MANDPKSPDVHEVPWHEEPDMPQLRRLHAQLATDPDTALPKLEELGNRGSLGSALYLGDYYYRNKNAAPENVDKAIFWFSKARDRNYPFAAYMAGRAHYERGAYELAASSFSKGAESGYLPCIYRLARLHRKGEGVPQDVPECKRLLEISSSRGHLFSRRDLAQMLMSGAFGPGSIFRGGFLWASLFSGVGMLFMKAARSESMLDEKVLA